MSDLLTAIGQWIETRIKARGFFYKLAVGLCFVIVIALFARDITQMVRGAG
ncbi:MAG: hypothetical protein AAFO80_08115 [Pseudomonadota bacterium]